MSKDIREYLHYFIGQQCRMTKPTYHAVHELRLSADTDFILTGKLCHYFSDGTTKAEVKPILRKLDSMTPDEMKELEATKAFQRATPVHQIKIMVWTAESYDWAFKKGFWVFGNDWFDEGYIIDKATLK